MKVVIEQIKMISAFSKVFFFFFLAGIFIFSIRASGQLILKEKDHTKDFGKSLKKYEKTVNSNSQNKETPDKSDDEPIRVETNLVANDVLVVNQKGNPVINLKQGDFVVTEDDVTQEIGLFSFGESAKIPRSIVLIIDYSGSLFPYINNSIEAAKILIDKLEPQDKLAIVTDDVELLVDFTNDKTSLKNTLENLKQKTLKNKGGKSLQFTALLAVLNEMFEAKDIRPIIILQTDGDEFVFLKPIKYFSNRSKEDYTRLCRKFDVWCERKFGFGDITEAVKKSRATIYSIIPGVGLLGLSEKEQTKRVENIVKAQLRKIFDSESKVLAEVGKYVVENRNVILAGQESLLTVAKLSGSYTDFIEKPEDAERVYSTIFSTISNRYTIGYYPKNEIKDGKQRNVNIKIKEHPEYIVFSRKSYFAPQE